MLDQNVGPLDRAMRIVLGVAVLSLVIIGPQSPWGLLGIIPLMSGILGICPFYRLIGFRTDLVRH